MTYEDLKRIYSVCAKSWDQLEFFESYCAMSNSRSYQITEIAGDLEWALNCIDEELTLLERGIVDNKYNNS